MNKASNVSPKKKRGGKTWQGQHKKKIVSTPLDLPLVAQGIPHISLSFIQKKKEYRTTNVTEKTKEETSYHSSPSVNEYVTDPTASYSQGNKMALKTENLEMEQKSEEIAGNKRLNCKDADTTDNRIDLVADEEPRMSNSSFQKDVAESEIEAKFHCEESEMNEGNIVEESGHQNDPNIINRSDQPIEITDNELNIITLEDKTKVSIMNSTSNDIVEAKAVTPAGNESKQNLLKVIEKESKVKHIKEELNLNTSKTNVKEEAKVSTVKEQNSPPESSSSSITDTRLHADVQTRESTPIQSTKKSLKEAIEKQTSSETNINRATEKEEKPESKVEFISVYSSEVKKKPQEMSKTIKDQEPWKEQPSVPIGPMQPVLQLVDPAQLEKETEKYYKEVGSIPKISQPSKPKCLTPGQIAKITKDYPQVIPNKDKSEDSEKVQTAWTLLHQYWTFVQENPYDFDGWTVLLNHVETMDNIEAARSAYEGFLPLYPYCFAYWMKLSDLELKFSGLEQALAVLYLGTKCVPFCTDLWVPLLNKFLEYATKENISEEVIRGLYEFALDSLGLSWQSSSIWDVCINYELTKGDLVRVMNLYRRVLSIPTKLYNKHWDHLLALVRDYHPRNLLTIEEYSNLKKSACDLLKIKFNPPSLEAPKTLLKVTQPEDKIHTTIKEKIVASLIPIHEANEKECNKRWKYEEKIKRPYFHVKPLEKKQLKTWREYLDFEIKDGDPVRIVTLFERCLVPCAMYEEFWCKYASYMEDHVLNVVKSKYANVEYKPGCFSQKKEKGSNENSESESGRTAMVNGDKVTGKEDKADKALSSDPGESVETNADFWHSNAKDLEVSPEIKFEVTFLLNRLSEGIGVGGRVLTPPSLTSSSILRGLTWEDVRQIYRRGAWIHCPSKPLILMQWAEFEEAQENIQTARELLNTVIVKHPRLLKARLQLIELERRNNELDRVEELYAQTFNTFSETRIRSCIAIRYARFLFKIKEEDDKALLILRKALKKDKGNIHLYHHVFDVCYQRRPIDCNGVLASVMLALASKELTLDDKYWFCIKRSEFLREHGTMAQLKEAKAEMEEVKRKLDKEKTFETKKNDDDDDEARKREEVKQELEEKIKRGAKAIEESKRPSPTEISPPKTNFTVTQNHDSKTQHPVSNSNSSSSSNHLHPRTNPYNNTSNNNSLIALQHPPMPPVLDPVTGSKGESKEEKAERRRRREGSSEGHRHKKRSSRSSSKKERRSKKSRRSEGRRKRGREEGEMKDDEDVEDMDEVYDASGTLLYSSKEDKNTEMNSNVALSELRPDQQLQQQRILPSEDKPYQAVPPSWDLNVPSLSSCGYGATSDLVKEGQNSLYERYYELIKQGYEAKERERNDQITNAQGGNVILGANNSYLPPPPMPQGILGESLFNQGKLENLRSLDGNHGNLPNTPPLLPPPTTCLGPAFLTRPVPQQELNTVEQPQGLLPHLPTPPPLINPLGLRPPTPQINPALLQTKPPNFTRGLLEPPAKMVRTEPPPQVGVGNQDQINMSQRNAVGLLGSYPGTKPAEREGRGARGGRGRDRNRPQQPPFNPQQTQINTSRPPPLINLSIAREMAQDTGKNPIFNVPEWLVSEGGELRISDTPNGDSIIRYWPRYMNEDGHTTLFQSLRKTVKWFQRKYLVAPPSENNWVNLPKLVSWIGPCNYEKEGMMLAANTSWPPEVVDLLHRLIHFSNSSFNSCFMSLYSSGHSYDPWHSEAHEAMSKNPTTASISLGAVRTLEMKRVDGSEYLRFPLFPGSLFVMEGATHTDWLCQIPKEPHVKAERISLSFRTMLMIKGVTV